jgi:hypothetical protein
MTETDAYSKKSATLRRRQLVGDVLRGWTTTAGDYVRIELGSFGGSGTVRPPISMQFEYITNHVFRLPGED